MFQPTFPYILKKRRRAQKLRQTELAKLCDIPVRKLNKFERGLRVPSGEELARLEWELGSFYGCSFRPSRYHETLRNQASRLCQTPEPFFPPKDRSNAVRYRAALHRYPDLVAKLTQRIRARPDFGLVNYFSEAIASGSAEECLYLMHLLAQGGQPGWLVPTSLGWLPHPVVDPDTREWVTHRPLPLVVVGQSYYFLQVSFATPALYSVDVLRWDGRWTVVEIDGEGHRGEGDEEKEAAVQLPFERIKTAELLRLVQ